jgi:hypothetical protein
MIIQTRPTARRGVLTAELAILLPTLGLLTVIIVDFSRAFFFYLTITNCALNGADYASGAIDPTIYYVPGAGTQTNLATSANITTYANYDAANLGGSLNVTATYGNDATYGEYVDVTATYQFNTIVDFMALTPPMNLKRTIRTRVIQQNPD